MLDLISKSSPPLPPPLTPATHTIIYDPIPISSKDMLDLTSRIGLGKAHEVRTSHVAHVEHVNDM